MDEINVSIAEESIAVTMTGGDTWDGISGKPTATAQNSFMVSDASPFSWLVKSLTQVKTILGLTQTVQTPVFANPLALDATTYKNFKPGLITGNTTVNMTGCVDGDAGQIELIIDGVGGYTVALGAMFTKKFGSTSIVATANADNLISWSMSGSDILYTIIQKV